jgi:hypothetical protein
MLNMKSPKSLFLSAVLAMAVPSISSATSFAVWLDGSTSDGGNAIPSRLDTAFGAGSATLVTTAQIETPGFLSGFDCLVVSRFDASFGTFLSPLAVGQVQSYVGLAGTPGQGGVAVFTNDMADNLMGSSSGDPFDPNLDQLFINAATFAAATHHGYIGEFNGALMAMAANSEGATPMDLLSGTAGALHGIGPEQFVYNVGPIGSGHAIDAGVTFPFTDSDTTTFLTSVTSADPNNIVDIYTNPSANGLPGVLANNAVISGVPDATSTLPLLSIAVASLLGYRWRNKQSTV